MFVMIAIAVWACALVIWWICSNAFRHSDLDKLKSRLIGTSKSKAVKVSSGGGGSLIHTEEKNVLLATKFLRRFQLQSKLQEMIEQAGMKWSTHRLVNTSLLAVVAVWALAWVLLPDQFRRFAYVPALLAGALPAAVCDPQAQGAHAPLRRAVSRQPGVRVALDARRACLLGVARNDSPRVSRTAGGRIPAHLRGTQPGLAAGRGAAETGQARSLAGRALLRFRGAAAKAHGRQSGRDSGQARLRDPGAVQVARPHPRHQRSRADDGHRAQLHPHRAWRCSSSTPTRIT